MGSESAEFTVVFYFPSLSNALPAFLYFSKKIHPYLFHPLANLSLRYAFRRLALSRGLVQLHLEGVPVFISGVSRIFSHDNKAAPIAMPSTDMLCL